jgi:hypothetical protein
MSPMEQAMAVVNVGRTQTFPKRQATAFTAVAACRRRHDTVAA